MNRTFTAVLPWRRPARRTVRRAGAGRHPGCIAPAPAPPRHRPAAGSAAGSASTARACRARRLGIVAVDQQSGSPGVMTSRCGSVSEARTTQPAAIASSSERATGYGRLGATCRSLAARTSATTAGVARSQEPEPVGIDRRLAAPSGARGNRGYGTRRPARGGRSGRPRRRTARRRGPKQGVGDRQESVEARGGGRATGRRS